MTDFIFKGMIMRTITTEIYKFDELSDAAKEKARDWYREASAGDDLDFVLEDAVTVAALMGIEISQRAWTNNYGFKGSTPEICYSAGHVQGDYAAFEGRYTYRKGAAKAVRGYASRDAKLHRIAQALQDVQARNFYQLTASCSTGRNWQDVSVDRADYRDMTDDAEEAVTEALRDFAHWIYKQVLAEVDYQSSDEYIDENIEANGYEFTENGRRA